MAPAIEDTLAVSDKRAAQLAGITMKQLRHWEETGLVVPSIRQEISPRNTVRLYSFQDLVQLLVAAELRHRPGISLQHIRRLVEYLRGQDFEAPLRELKFATHGGTSTSTSRTEAGLEIPSRTSSFSARPLPSTA